MAALERRLQVFLDDQAATGTVDDPDTLAGLRQRFGVQQVAGAVGQRRVQRDEIGAGQKLVQFDLLDAQIDGPFMAEIGVESCDPHLQPKRPVGDDRPDIAATDDAQHLGRQLDAHEAVLFPLAGLGRGVGDRKISREREHHGDGVLGRGDRIAERRVHHDHAARSRGRDVHIVHADAGTPDHLEPGCRRQDILGHLGGRPDRQPIVLADDRFQFFRLQAGLNVHFDTPLAEDFNRARAQAVGDQDFGMTGCPPAQEALTVSDFTVSDRWQRPTRSRGSALRYRCLDRGSPQIRRPAGASRYEAVS